jgi:CTP:molybdopterin cytidylyltransferase MocA
VPGHPVLLDRSVWGAVAAAATGDRGAGAFLDARPDVVTVACDGLGRPADVDTREDLAALEQRTE